MAKPTLSPELEARQQRLAYALSRLIERGQTQRQIASALNVPPQYLSDVKNGHRTITEPFLRRIAEVYRVSFDWLMDGEGPESVPQLDVAPGTATSGVILPVLTVPAEGDPGTSPDWDGSQIIVAGAPAVIASRAKWPYVLRYAGEDDTGRLANGDLLLITEGGEAPSELMTVKAGRTLRLARHDQGQWYSLDVKPRVLMRLKLVGAVRGIVWAPFR